MLEGGSLAGKSCETVNDCPPELVCVLARPGEGRTCEALSGPQYGDTSGGGNAGPAYWCDGVDQVMTKYCAACHGENRAASGYDNFRLDMYEDAEGRQGAASMVADIKRRMLDQRTMPPPPDMPTAEELSLVQAWIKAGAPLCGTDMPDAGL